MAIKKKMNKAQLDYFKKRLTQMKEDLLHDIHNMDEVNSVDSKPSTGESSGHGMHMADAATDMYDREFNLGLASNERELLTKIDSALKRIDDGSYGLCLKSHKPIPAARLKAIPYAEYTVAAQEELEKEKSKSSHL